ncbi:hypothetical protein F5Y03DRAFT_145449 [Xylaria venustula]|nr:hypothetical protein F5Y03DRAFT_145449 [Xylaria venustula]
MSPSLGIHVLTLLILICPTPCTTLNARSGKMLTVAYHGPMLSFSLILLNLLFANSVFLASYGCFYRKETHWDIGSGIIILSIITPTR